MVEPFLPDEEKLAAVREAIPATAAGILLDTATAGPRPAESARAAEEAEAWDLRVGRAGPDREPDVAQRLDEARAVVAALLGASVDSVAILPGSTAALAAAIGALTSEPGAIVTTSLSTPDLLAALAAARRTGREVVVAEAGDGSDPDAVATAVERAAGGEASLIACPLVSAGTGALLPVERIADAAHARGARVLVDAGHAAGAIPVHVGALRADAVVTAGHRWLLGPEGTAALWLGDALLRRAASPLAGPRAFEILLPTVQRPWPDARALEFDAPGRTAVLELARAVGWLEMYVGLEWLHERGIALAGRLADDLAAIDGVQVLTPRARMATIVAFRVRGWPTERVVDELSHRVHAVLGTSREHDAVRASVAFFATAQELARFVAAVAELARHTPETLPRRPGLVVLRAPSEAEA